MTSEVRPQTSHYLEKKAMCEQSEGLPKNLKKTWEGANEATIEDIQKRVHMEAFGGTQEDDGQRLRAGAQGEAIEDFQKRAQLR